MRPKWSPNRIRKRKCILNTFLMNFRCFSRCVFRYVFRQRVFTWGLFLQSATCQNSVLFVHKTDDFQVSRFSAEYKKQQISSGISMQKTQEIQFEIPSENGCWILWKSDEKLWKMEAEIENRRMEAPECDFSDSDRILVDFGCPGWARISTEPEKSMPEKV